MWTCQCWLFAGASTCFMYMGRAWFLQKDLSAVMCSAWPHFVYSFTLGIQTLMLPVICMLIIIWWLLRGGKCLGHIMSCRLKPESAILNFLIFPKHKARISPFPSKGIISERLLPGFNSWRSHLCANPECHFNQVWRRPLPSVGLMVSFPVLLYTSELNIQLCIPNNHHQRNLKENFSYDPSHFSKSEEKGSFEMVKY